MSENTAGELDKSWQHALANLSVVAVFLCAAMPLVFFVGIGRPQADIANGVAYREFFQAVRAPGAYRTAMILDALLWLSFGGTLVLLGGLFRRRSPIRAALLAACGAGQLLGILAGCLRIGVIPLLADQYRTDPAAHTAILQSFLLYQRLAIAHSQAASLLLGLGFALAVTVAWSDQSFPRWIACWMALPAVLPLLQFAMVAGGNSFSLPLVVLYVVVGYGGLSAAMAFMFRPRTPVSVV